MIEDIIALRFNPGDSVANYRTAERGISILYCRPRGYTDTEMIRDRELAVESTTSTCTMEEANRLTKIGSPRTPASNFYELRRNVGTYCGFLHTLFRPQCEHYKSLMMIKSVLDQSGTQAMVESYTSNVCRHIVWAIVCDGQYFFSKVKLCPDLKNGVWDDPPKSLLDLSIDRGIYATLTIPKNGQNRYGNRCNPRVRVHVGHYHRLHNPSKRVNLQQRREVDHAHLTSIHENHDTGSSRHL